MNDWYLFFSREKCDALTLELAEQESARRAAVGELEARAHAAWLEARAARRDADAAKDDAAILRRRLAALTRAEGAASPHARLYPYPNLTTSLETFKNKFGFAIPGHAHSRTFTHFDRVSLLTVI